MGRLRIFPGDRFGKLTVIKQDETRADNRRYYICKCDCGKIVAVKCSYLISGHTRSCGCLKLETKSNLRHGLRHTKIYFVWQNMRKRCFNPKSIGYKNYGGRGITVCPEWAGSDGFKAFYDYVSKLEHFGEEGYTLDRIDVNGHYEVGNLRWATDAEQRRNRTDNHYVKINGEQMIVSDVAQMVGVTPGTILRRLSLGANEEQLLKEWQDTTRLIEINGEKLTFKEIAERAGVAKTTIQSRVKAGLTSTELLKPAKQVARYEVDGQQMTAGEIAHKAGLSIACIMGRIKRGWTGTELLKPVRK